MNASQQIQAAARKFAPQIYRAVMAQPTAAGRAQVLRMILVGIDPALSDRIADHVETLEAQGLAPRQAVLQALADGLTVHMAELAVDIDAGMDGLGLTTTTTTTTTRTPIAIAQQQQRTARIEAVSGAITNIGGLVNNLTQTAGNIAISAVQARQGQTVTGLPGAPQPAAAPLGPDPYATAPYGTTPPPAGPPWGLILGGAAVVVVLGGAYYYTTQQKQQPARAAA